MSSIRIRIILIRIRNTDVQIYRKATEVSDHLLRFVLVANVSAIFHWKVSEETFTFVPTSLRQRAPARGYGGRRGGGGGGGEVVWGGGINYWEEDQICRNYLPNME